MRLREGSRPSDAVANLRDRANAALNTMTAGHDSEGMLRAYQQVSLESVRMLGNQFLDADSRDLVFTRRYWALQAPGGGVSRDMVIPVIMDELALRQRLLNQLADSIEADFARWQRGALVVPDTSALIHGPKLADWDPAEQLGLRDSPVQIVLPILVLDELDGLKESSKAHTRHRARETLNWLTATMRGQPSMLTRQRSASETPDGMRVRGEVYVDVLADPPDHRRVNIADDEIVGRAMAVGSLAGRPVTLVTNDYGQAFRASLMSVKVAMVDEPIYDVDLRLEAQRIRDEAKAAERQRRERW